MVQVHLIVFIKPDNDKLQCKLLCMQALSTQIRGDTERNKKKAKLIPGYEPVEIDCYPHILVILF